MQDTGAGLLGHAVIVAKGDDLLFPFGQLFNGSAQRHMLHHLVFRAEITQHQFERKAVLSALPLDAVGRAGGRFGKSDLLGAQARFGRELRHFRLPPDTLFQKQACLPDLHCLFLDRAADLNDPVVAQEAADLSGDLRHGVSGKLRAVAEIKALDGF